MDNGKQGVKPVAAVKQRTIGSQTDFRVIVLEEQAIKKSGASGVRSSRRKRGGVGKVVTNLQNPSSNTSTNKTSTNPTAQRTSVFERLADKANGTPNKAPVGGRKPKPKGDNNGANEGPQQQKASKQQLQQQAKTLPTVTASLARLTTNCNSDNHAETQADHKPKVSVQKKLVGNSKITGSQSASNNPSMLEQQLPQQKPRSQQQLRVLPPKPARQRHVYTRQQLLAIREKLETDAPIERTPGSAPNVHARSPVAITMEEANTNQALNEPPTPAPTPLPPLPSDLNNNKKEAQSGRNIIYMTNRVALEQKARIMIEAIPFRMPGSSVDG